MEETAEEREKVTSVSCSAGLKVDSKDVGQNESSDDDFSGLYSLTVQRYEGESREGQFHGAGVACFEGGHLYKGMFSKGLMDGHGVFTKAGGLKYEGDFVCNMPMGQGIYTWPDGSSYEGEVLNGVRHGTGTYTCATNGVLYAGQWDQGRRHGKGVVYYNQDKTSWYKGNWVKNNREGWGVRCYPSGNIYSGEWKNNLRHGEGTMRWIELGQRYDGMWENGIQHGRGTHVWILTRVDGSQYSQSNQYSGDFVQGQKHGQGTFYYAGGAIYEGEWRHNKKHGKGKLTSKDGHVIEGEFVDDQMMTPNLNGSRAPTPLCVASPRSGCDSSVLGPDMALNIECLLDKIPERRRDSECKQVEFVMLRKSVQLRSIYIYYSKLGHGRSADNTFLLTRLQLWRLLKDCKVHHHGVTLTQIDRYIREDAPAAEIHSPFTPVLLRRLLSCLVVVAYHIYHKDTGSQDHLLAACFSKLMTDNILPNAKNVKGFLFRQPDCAEISENYLRKCWEIYQAYCKLKAANRDEQTMTCRHLLLMFKDLHLLDSNLTTAKLLKIITTESCDPSNLSACLELEITFLEFFEVLLGSAEVKCQQLSEGLEEGHSLSSPDAEPRRDEVEASKEILHLAEKSQESPAGEDVESRQEVETKVDQKPQTAEHRGGERVQTRNPELGQMIDQFFNQFFFPAFEHYQLVTRNMEEEEVHQEAQKHISMDEI